MSSSQRTHTYDTHEVASFAVPQALEASVLQRLLDEVRTDKEVLSVDEVTSATSGHRSFMIVYQCLLGDSGRRSSSARMRIQAILNKYQ